ncbi:unnamed protein product [Tilletia laevis]|uniref:VPS37 C-terminal domain-containing protein n=3 Tax=Tilletia TaxID=13289 RepID=A0A8X7MJZ1_9BASI|nr:hypothetical protein CF336_g8425 [Tilletia laevis]KAE8191576.1 hypothetical protein CF328_g5640 [Tilletia controversa]KAE8242746.1 hypothetical protein A4X03_0g7979 [Tilletia caries]KAE8194385.1 hypothetical protein CF335_g5358 [Tilletia laevis]KAE8238529.1 hypothetical protein A4X06_0g8723 [Tilletia controversa]
MSADQHQYQQYAAPSGSAPGGGPSTPGPGPMSAPAAAATAPLPDTPLARDFPHIASLPRHSLEDLAANKDPQLFSALIHTEPTIASLLQQRSDLLNRVRELAKRNDEQLRPPLERVREDTQRYFAQAREAEEVQWKLEERKLAEAHRRFAPPALLAQLQQSTAKIYEQSEDLANALVEGRQLPPSLLAAAREVSRSNTAAGSSSLALEADAEDTSTADPIQTFTKAFLSLRIAYHRRAMLEERWRRDTIRI